MSLILDALNRSRQDTESMPGISSEHYVARGTGDGGWLQWLLVSALVVAVLVIGWLLFERWPNPQPQREPPLVQAAKPASVAAEPAAPQTAIVPAPAPQEAVPVADAMVRSPAQDSSQARLSAPAREIAVEPTTAPAPAVTPAAAASVTALYQQRERAEFEEPAATTAPEAAALRAAKGRAEQTAIAEEVLDIEQLVTTAEADLADARLAPHAVPFLSALSQQSKDAVPTLMYQRHDYSADPARSSVVINGKTLRAGEAVAGVKVDEILADSVVLQSGGTRFRLRALNSWVNL